MYFIKSDIYSIKNLALTALTEKLYIEGFQLKNALEKILLVSPDKLKTTFIILAKEHEHGEIIGISTFLMTEYCTIQTFVKEKYRGRGYGFELIRTVIDNVPQKFKNRIRLAEGDSASFLLFRRLFLEGVISESAFIEERTKNKLNILDVYLFCKKHNLDTHRYAPGWETCFSENERELINQHCI